MLLRRMVTPRRTDSLSTIFSTLSLDVKSKPYLSWKTNIRKQKEIPMSVDIPTDTTVANFAPFPLPAPSSFATRTLAPQETIKIKKSEIIQDLNTRSLVLALVGF